MRTRIIYTALLAFLILSCTNKKEQETKTTTTKRQYAETFIGDNKEVLMLNFLPEKERIEVKFNEKEFTLKQIPSASGNKYKNGTYELTQWQGETTLKKGKKTLFVQTPKTLKGELSMGHEANIFQPCGGKKEYWIYDTSGKLNKQYNEVTEGAEPYTVIFAEVKVIDRGVSEDGFSEEYDGVYEVIKVLKTREISEEDCK